MKKMDAVDVMKIVLGVARDVKALDLSAGFPVGGIILALALKEYYGPEALTGEGRVRIDGEEIDILNARIAERARYEHEAYRAHLRENGAAAPEAEWAFN